MFTADPVDVGGQPDGERRHVKTLPLGFRGISQAEKIFAREAQLLPIAGKVPIHEVMGKYIVAGRHGCMGGKHRALADDLTRVRGPRAYVGALHRLDRGTSGLVAVALSRECHAAGRAAFRDHAFLRRYLALVDGVPKAATGTIRCDFALELSKNIVHGSDSKASARRELKLFFPGGLV